MFLHKVLKWKIKKNSFFCFSNGDRPWVQCECRPCWSRWMWAGRSNKATGTLINHVYSSFGIIDKSDIVSFRPVEGYKRVKFLGRDVSTLARCCRSSGPGTRAWPIIKISEIVTDVRTTMILRTSEYVCLAKLMLLWLLLFSWLMMVNHIKCWMLNQRCFQRPEKVFLQPDSRQCGRSRPETDHTLAAEDNHH